MKTLTFFVSALAFAACAQAQSNTFPTSGNAGVGTTGPGYPLTVNGSGGDLVRVTGDNSSNVGIGIQNVGFGNPQLRFLNSSGNERIAFTLINDWESAGKGALAIFDGTSNVFNIRDGFVGIGTQSPTEQLSVNGKIRAREIKITVSGWPDYVFAKEYRPLSLGELGAYVKLHRHLPEMPSASEVETNGAELGEMNKLLLKKVEELTLYLVEKDEQVSELKTRLDKAEKRTDALARKMKALESLSRKK